jgi:hypothetical protein
MISLVLALINLAVQNGLCRQMLINRASLCSLRKNCCGLVEDKLTFLSCGVHNDDDNILYVFQYLVNMVLASGIEKSNHILPTDVYENE